MIKDGQQDKANILYDRVLVDAECTHDGSMKHILKYKDWGWDTFEKRFLDPDRISNITRLQKVKLGHSPTWIVPRDKIRAITDARARDSGLGLGFKVRVSITRQQKRSAG